MFCSMSASPATCTVRPCTAPSCAPMASVTIAPKLLRRHRAATSLCSNASKSPATCALTAIITFCAACSTCFVAERRHSAIFSAPRHTHPALAPALLQQRIRLFLRRRYNILALCSAACTHRAVLSLTTPVIEIPSPTIMHSYATPCQHIYANLDKLTHANVIGGGVAPSLHPASYAYAYDQCTNRSRWAQKNEARAHKERSGGGYGLANAPPAVHFAVFRYPQRQSATQSKR